MNQKRSEIRDSYNKDLRKLKARFTDKVEPLLSSAEETAKSRVRKIDAVKLHEIKAIADLEISPAEFNEIASGYVNDYWSCNALRQIAKKNDICAEDCPNFKVEPGLMDELAVLDEIRSECNEFTATYDGTDELSHLMLLANSHVDRWERRATNSLISESDMTDRQLVRRAFDRVAQCRDELSKGQQITKELDGIRDSARLELIDKIASANTITDTAIAFSKCADELREYKQTGTTAEYSRAKEMLKNVLDATEKNAHQGLMALDSAGAEDNRFFSKMVQNEVAKNPDSKLAQNAKVVDSKRHSNLTGEKEKAEDGSEDGAK